MTASNAVMYHVNYLTLCICRSSTRPNALLICVRHIDLRFGAKMNFLRDSAKQNQKTSSLSKHAAVAGLQKTPEWHFANKDKQVYYFLK